jgi:hypothetical protein
MQNDGILALIALLLGIAVLITFFNMGSRLKRIAEDVALSTTYLHKMAQKTGALDEQKTKSAVEH